MLAVLAFHAGANWLPAGFLGVDIFFVVSGFLITTLLVREQERSGKIALGRFWLRRAGRLLPALLLMLAGTIAYLALAAPGLVARFWEDVRFALLFVANWDFVVRDIPYFVRWEPSLGTHLWSLAVEEQFYLLWPLLAGLVLRIGGVRGLAMAAGGLALVSALLMGLLYVPFGDASRIYFGTDTHAFGLATGAVLGCLLHMYPSGAGGRARLRESLGCMALVLVIAAMILLHEWDGFLYRGGYLVMAVLAGVVTFAATADEGLLVAALGWRPIRWIGRRSYAIYLWHWPLLLVPGPPLELAGGPVELPDWLGLGLRTALVFAAAAISWQFVESPLRSAVSAATRAPVSGARGLAGILRGNLASARLGTGTAVACLAGILVLGGLASGGAFEQSKNQIAVQIEANVELLAASQRARVFDKPPRQTDPIPEPDGDAPAAPKSTNPLKVVAFSSDVVAIDYVPSLGLAPPRPTVIPPQLRVLAIGDSVMLGAADVLLESLPQLEIEAAVSTQFLDGITRIRSEIELPYGERPGVIVLHLGTNGIFDPSYVDELRDFTNRLRRLVVINIRAPRAWEKFVNEQLAQVADLQKVKFIDWHQASAEQPDWLADDRVHLTDTGKRAYAALIAHAISL